MAHPAVVTQPAIPGSPVRAGLADEGRGASTTELSQLSNTVQPKEATLQKVFTADTSTSGQTDHLLRRNIQQASPQNHKRGIPEPFSTSDQIMQRVATHQGLERVLSIYNNLSGIVRRVAGTLAITQKSR